MLRMNKKSNAIARRKRLIWTEIDWLMIAYIALFSALLSRLTALACGSTWVTSFLWGGVLAALAWLVPHETATISVQVLCTPYNHAPCHFMQSHIRKVYACLAVTCHLHFWQNDQDLLRATVVTQGWNGYWNSVWIHYLVILTQCKEYPCSLFIVVEWAILFYSQHEGWLKFVCTFFSFSPYNSNHLPVLLKCMSGCWKFDGVCMWKWAHKN